MAAESLNAAGLAYNSAGTAVTVTAEYSSTSLKASDYTSSVITITGAARTKALNIEGNAKANKIVGTSAKDTINGGAGNDTLTGGDGADVFIFDGKGKDAVTDYVAGEDTLKLTSGTVGTYSISGSDATFKVGSGTVKVSGGKNKAITVVDSKNKTYTYDGGLIYEGDVAKAKAVSVTAAYGNTLASYGASVVTIDSSARTKALNIVGNAAANKITGTSANDTIDGGGGNDTLTGGKGKDLFVYENGGGNDLVYDYTSGQDTIKISGGEVSDYSLSGSDAVLKVGSGSLKVKGGKSAAVLVVDDNKKVSLYQGGAIYNAASATKATAATLTSAYGNTFTAGTSMISVDASERKNTINIVGSAKNNFLVGGAGKDIIDGGKCNDSISGGKGSDILTGGAGADVFIYANGDGTDAITDYVSGEDVIKLTSGAVKSYSVKNGDAILKVGSGAITLKGAGNNAVSVLDANDVLTVYNGGLIYNNPKISRADVVTITADYDSEFNSYGASVETIDAAARTKAIEITGNGADNFILGGKGKDTIDAGKGNDTIYAGKGNDLLTGGKGDDVFFYATGDGNDTITDYGTGSDIISVNGAVSYSTKNGDAVLKIGSGNVTLKDAAEVAVTVVGEDSVASIYSGKNVSTKTWTGISSSSSGETVTVTETVEVEVTLPAETVTVEAEPVTITIGGGDTVTVEVTLPPVTLPAETITVGGGETVTVEVTLPPVTLPAETITVYGGDTVEPITLPNDPDVDYNGVTVTLEADRKANFSLNEYNTTTTLTAVNVDGSLVRTGIRIDGDEKANIIYASKQNCTILPGKGNDVIYCGAGRDTIYYYTDYENEVVYNYSSGDQFRMVRRDQWETTTFQNVLLSGDDVIINYTNGSTITLKDAKEQRINLEGLTYNYGGLYSYNKTFGQVTISGASGTATLDAAYEGTFVPAEYALNPANVDASSVRASMYIYGDARANEIHGTRENTTIRARGGNDTIYCGRGYDTIQYYTGDGNDVIYDYRTNDFIRLYRVGDYDETKLKNVSLNDSDVILNLTDGSSLTLKNAKDQRIQISLYAYDYDSNSGYWQNYSKTFGQVTISGASGTATLDAAYEGTFVPAEYALNPANVDASSVRASMYIYGDARANEIHGTRENTTIRARGGNDTIYCGRGYDTIQYYTGDGNDVIYDYRTNDFIRLYRVGDYDETKFKNVSLSGSDVILNLTDGSSLTLKDAKDQRIQISLYAYDYDSNSGNWQYYNNTYGKVTISGGAASLKSDYQGEFYSSQYASSFTTINASAVTSGATIHGSSKADVIYASKNAGRIYAGAGNDTIYFGSSSQDTLMYYSGGGNDVVYNIGDSDYIYLNNCTAESVSVSGTDVIINIKDSSDKITLKDGTGKRIYISGQGYQTYTASNGNAAVPWFAEDDTNFTTTADLDSLMETPIANSSGALSVGGGDSLSPFNYDFALAHTNDK